MRLVLDTDVLVAGLRSRVGASRILLCAVEEKIIQPLISVATILEYEEVLTRSTQLAAMRLTLAGARIFLDQFIGMAIAVAPHYDFRGLIRDPNDDKFVTVAINGRADAIVTFNVRDYRPRDDSGVGLALNICRPGDIVRRLPWRPTATSRSGFLPH